MSTPLKPCGTYAAYRRHHQAGEPPCEPCTTANREYRANLRRANGINANTKAADLIEDITFLLNAGEGEHAILKATGYTNNPASLQRRLQKHGRNDLYNRVVNNWELAA
ncbi:hypothetical protein ACFRJ8_14875 [Arthrobacter sp. NPDC056886]|uniref:hypothetical protein n=1 Tax=Arthrobacter sp. NPDC056886 TaxID=3345960 RepID=UPI00366E2CFC